MELTDNFHRRKDPDNKAIEIIQTETHTVPTRKIKESLIP